MTRFLRLAALAALAFPLALAAQPADRGDRADRRVEHLTERLSLTDAQVALVRQAFTSERSPAASWELAARLAPTLSDAQLAALRSPRTRENGERKARWERGDRAARQRPDGERQRPERASGDRRERPSAEQRDAMRAEMDAARDAALGLSAQQKQALAALRAERQEARGSDAMAEVLTDEQEAILLVHRALSGPRGMRGGHGGGHGGGHRDSR